MERTATAIWRGGPGAGEGQVTTSSGVIQKALYAFGSSFGSEPCTSPSEMLAAALSSCITMMVSQELARLGLRSESVRAEATLTLNEVDQRWTITKAHVKLSVQVPEVDPGQFNKAIAAATEKCPISRALNIDVSVDSKLEPVFIHTNA
ncbi:MAG TPA: OsmC family peroxiredoxin [Clostridia bacterium]|nr:OsmC family peroxiredoxin [Clostridia bacterium]